MSVSNGARMGALASFLLAGACMAGEDTAGNAQLGTGIENAADPGAGGGPDINARFQVAKLTADQTSVAAFTEPQLRDVWGVTSLDDRFLAVAQDASKLLSLQPNGDPAGKLEIMLDDAINGITKNDSDRIQVQIKGKCGQAKVLVSSQRGVLWAVNAQLNTTEGVRVIDRRSTEVRTRPQFTGVALIPELSTQGGHDDQSGTDDHGGGGGCSCDDSGHGGGQGARQTVLLVDFHNARVVAYNDRFQPISNLGNKFQIPRLPKDFAPFGIKAFEDMVVITAAQRRAPNASDNEDFDQQVAGDGKGVVAAFDLTGKLMWSTASDKAFNIPWGLEMGGVKLCATGALLVGQHGDDTRLDGKGNSAGGTIVALDPRTGKVIHALMASDKQPVRVQGLWGLTFGEDIQNIDPNLLHMAAGPEVANGHGQKDTVHGLFARLDPMMQGPTL